MNTVKFVVAKIRDVFISRFKRILKNLIQEYHAANLFAILHYFSIFLSRFPEIPKSFQNLFSSLPYKLNDNSKTN